jgi:hypothetical protein
VSDLGNRSTQSSRPECEPPEPPDESSGFSPPPADRNPGVGAVWPEGAGAGGAVRTVPTPALLAPALGVAVGGVVVLVGLEGSAVAGAERALGTGLVL